MASLAEKRVIMSEQEVEVEVVEIVEMTDAQERPEELRQIEALLFAAGEPLDEKALAKRLPEGVDVRAALRRLQTEYAPRGVNLVACWHKWAFRTANDLAYLLTHESVSAQESCRAPRWRHSRLSPITSR